MTHTVVPLELHPDRLLPPEPGMRAIARRLYEAIRELPLIAPHGHVDPRVLLADEPFGDPASLFVTPDHYVTRLLHASGVGLEALGVGQGELDEAASREVWRALCSHWDVFRGTPVRFWLEAELAEIFGVTARPSAQTADAIYDELADRLAQHAYRPRALYEPFRHQRAGHDRRPVRRPVRARRARRGPDMAGAGDPDVPPRPLPRARAGRLARRSRAARRGRRRGHPATTTGSSHALEERRRYFLAHGATSADHSHEDVAHAIHSIAARRDASTAPPWPVSPRRRRRWRSGATCCSRWRGCHATTGSR